MFESLKPLCSHVATSLVHHPALHRSTLPSPCTGPTTAVPFGNATRRLKHIIEQYADGPGVLLELAQNADDAGASEIRFLLDTCSYRTNSLLGVSDRAADKNAWNGLFITN